MKRFIGAVGFRVGTRVVAALLQATSWAVLARVLGVHHLAAVATGIVVGAVASAFTGMGAVTRGLRLMRETEPVSMARTLSRFSVLVAAVAGSSSFATASLLGQAPLAVALLAASISSSEYLGSLTQAVIAGLQAQAMASTLLVVLRVVPLGALFFAQVSGSDPLIGYLVGLSVVLGGLVFWAVRPGSAAPFSELVGTGAGYTVSAVSGTVSGLDVVLVQFLGGASLAGLYAAGGRLVSPLSIVVSSFLSVLVPTASMRSSRKERQTLFRRALLVMLIPAAGLIVCSPVLASAAVWLLGEQYRHAFSYVIAVIVGVAVSSLSQVIQAELITEGAAGYAGIAVMAGSLSGLGVAWGSLAMKPELLWVVPPLAQLLVFGCLVFSRMLARKSGVL